MDHHVMKRNNQRHLKDEIEINPSTNQLTEKYTSTEHHSIMMCCCIKLLITNLNEAPNLNGVIHSLEIKKSKHWIILIILHYPS